VATMARSFTARPGMPERQLSVSATQLRAMWRTASRERGWSFPDDWWTPAVDAVTEAVVSDGDIAERCTRLGRSRARAGVSMSETLDDVIVMASLVRAVQAHPTFQTDSDARTVEVVELVRAAAVGWAEAASPVEQLTPADQISPLPGCSYLSIRLGEVVAEVESKGQQLSEEYAFVVASLLGPSHLTREPADALQERVEAWDRAWQMSQLAGDLRLVFTAGETIVQAGPTTAIVLARRTPSLAGRVSALRALIEQRRIAKVESQVPIVGIWVEGLPGSLRQVRALLDDLRR